MTPLHVAARDGNKDKVLELLEKGADPCIQERGGRTPYAVAMDKGHLMVFVALWLAILICGIGTQLQKHFVCKQDPSIIMSSRFFLED
jgi:hypothetical protein